MISGIVSRSSIILISLQVYTDSGSRSNSAAFFLVKENHQPGWWFQKALAMSRKNILLW